MTPAERDKPKLINPSRKRRIAAGCGLQVVDVNRLLKSVRDAPAAHQVHEQGTLPGDPRHGRDARYGWPWKNEGLRA